jgi:hypothetical protein
MAKIAIPANSFLFSCILLLLFSFRVAKVQQSARETDTIAAISA